MALPVSFLVPGGQPTKCSYCDATFSRLDDFSQDRHQCQEKVSALGANHGHRCEICEKIFTRKDSLHKHLSQVHSGKRYQCNMCPASFAQSYKLKKHSEKHQGYTGILSKNQDKKDESRDAVPSTSEQSEMDQRQGKQTRSKTRKQMKRKAYLSPSTLNSTDSSDDGQRSKSMAKCKACLWEGQSLRAHLNQTTNSCINMYDNEALQRDAQKKHEEQKTKWESQHKKDRNEKKKQKRGIQNDSCRRQLPIDRAYELTCFCGKTFGTSYAKDRHIEEAHNNHTKPFQCPKCSKSFKRREHLRDHLDSVHDKSTSVNCLYCSKELSSFTNYMRHIKEVHERRNGNVVCNVCDKKFSRKQHLDQHISDVHLRQKRFSCPHCKNTYVRKGVLERHLYVAHQNSPRMVWPCPDCPEYFFREDILDKHEKRGKYSFYEYCKYCDEVLLFKSFNAMDSHFVKVKNLTYIQRTRGFSKDTCGTKLERDKNQLEEFEQGSTICIHCNETVPNEDYGHWIRDYEAPGKGTCINDLRKRTHITCWMCKERVVIKDYFNKENNGWGYFNHRKDGCHYNNIQDPCSCRAAMKNRRGYAKKRLHMGDILEKREKDILNNIPFEKDVGFKGYHIICYNS